MRAKKDPTLAVKIIVIAIVVVVAGTVLYNSISQKEAFDRTAGGGQPGSIGQSNVATAAAKVAPASH